RLQGDWSSDVCSSDLGAVLGSSTRGSHNTFGAFSSPLYGFFGLLLALLGALLLSCQLYIGISDLEGRRPELHEVLRLGGRKFLRSEERRVGKECRCGV